MMALVTDARPWPYGFPGQLTAPKQHQTFNEFLRRLRTFSRDSLLDCGARLAWGPWQRGERRDPRDVGADYVRLYSADIITLALMYAPLQGRLANQRDVQHLCAEFHMLPSVATKNTSLHRRGIDELRTAWVELLGKTPFSDRGDDRGLNLAFGLWERSFHARRWSTQVASLDDDVLRVALTMRTLDRVVPDELRERVRRFTRAFFRSEPMSLVRTAIKLAAQTSRQDAFASTTPGMFEMCSRQTATADEADVVSIAALTARSAAAYRALGLSVAAAPARERKRRLLLDGIARDAAVVLEDTPSALRVLFPMPGLLFAGTRELLINRFVEELDAALDRWRAEPAPIDVPPNTETHGVPLSTTLLGDAVDAHVREVVRGFAEQTEPATKKDPSTRPEALWIGERFGVAIEAKARITPRSDKRMASPRSLLEAWKRAWEAVDQAESFVERTRLRGWLEKHGLRDPGRWVAVIVVDDTQAGAETSFCAAASHLRLFDGLRLEAAAVLTIGQLEQAVRTTTPDELAEYILESWALVGADPIGQPNAPVPWQKCERPQYLRRIYDDLAAS